MLRRSRYVLFFPLNCDGLLSFVLDEFALNIKGAQKEVWARFHERSRDILTGSHYMKEVLCLQPLSQSKRFTFPPVTGGCSE